MENKFTSVKERVIQIAEKQGIAKEKFFEKIGMTYGNFKGKAKETPLNSDALANILSNFPQVDPGWLITGIGEMYKPQPTQIKLIGQEKAARRVKEQDVPLYDIKATAGIVELLTERTPTKHIPIDYIHIPNLPKCDGALPISGDSMYPLLKSGDLALYKEVHDHRNIIWGEMYLISIIHNGDEFFFVKFIQKGDQEGWIKLVSQNSNHQAMEFPQDSIKALALVKATVRINMAF